MALTKVAREKYKELHVKVMGMFFVIIVLQVGELSTVHEVIQQYIS
jgi:hypothetical protein